MNSTERRPFDAIVVGGGIAGLASAFYLCRAGLSVCLFERERQLAAHASGRNAAIFRHLERDLASTRLAVRSRELLSQLPSEGALFSPTGAVYVGTRGRLAPLAELARAIGLSDALLDRGGLARCSPALEGTDADAGLFVAEDGVLDVHGIALLLARESRRLGAVIRLGEGVRVVVSASGRTGGVELETGEFVAAGRVVVAAGAWTSPLGDASAAPLPIEPRRRHLAMLVPPDGPVGGPVVWRVDEEVYFRPESGGVLASPCDEASWPPGVPETDPEALVRLATRLARLSPRLGGARVRSSWACLRSFAPDARFVVGEDPRTQGLFWLAGLGGRGMTCGLALGELLAAAAMGRHEDLLSDFRVGRLVSFRS